MYSDDLLTYNINMVASWISCSKKFYYISGQKSNRNKKKKHTTLCISFSGTQRYGCPLLTMYLTLDVWIFPLLLKSYKN